MKFGAGLSWSKLQLLDGAGHTVGWYSGVCSAGVLHGMASFAVTGWLSVGGSRWEALGGSCLLYTSPSPRD
eukprot:10514358-Alexandrium_andersonii.AAC.1